MTIGERIKLRREQLGMTQDEVAKNAVISLVLLLTKLNYQELCHCRKLK